MRKRNGFKPNHQNENYECLQKIPLEIHHCAVSEAKTLAPNYDVVVCSNSLLDVFKNVDQSKTKIIGLKNLLSEKEIEEKVREIVLGE